MSLFRNEAIEAKRLRLWGEVRLAQPPSLTIWTVVLTLLNDHFASVTLEEITRIENVIEMPRRKIFEKRNMGEQIGQLALFVNVGEFLHAGGMWHAS